MKKAFLIIGIMLVTVMASAQDYSTHTVHWGDGTNTTVTTIGNHTYFHDGHDREDYIDKMAREIRSDLYNIEDNKKCLKFEKTRVYYRTTNYEEIKSSESVDMGGYTKVVPVKSYKYYIEEWVYEGVGYLINPMENFTPDSVYVTSHEGYSIYDDAANAEMVLRDGVLNVHVFTPRYTSCGIYHYNISSQFGYGIYGSIFRNSDDIVRAIGVYGFYSGTMSIKNKEYDRYECKFGMSDPILKSHTVKEVDKDTYKSFSDYMFTDKETVERMKFNERLHNPRKPREFYNTKPKNDGFVKYPNNIMHFDLCMDSVKIGSADIKDPTLGGLMKADTIVMPKKGVKYVIYFKGKQVGTAVVESLPELGIITILNTPGKLNVKFNDGFNFTSEPMYYKLVKEEYTELYEDNGKLSRKRLEKKYGSDYFTKWMHCSIDMGYILWR